MDNFKHTESSLSQEELRRIQRESELEAEMEFAPHNFSDRVETDYVPQLDADDGILPDSEFFEPDPTETVAPAAVPEAVPEEAPAPVQEVIPIYKPQSSARPKAEGAPEPARKPTDSIDAMVTAPVPVEAMDGLDTKPAREPQTAQKKQQAQQEAASYAEEDDEEEPAVRDSGKAARIVLTVGIALILLAVLGFLISMAIMQGKNKNAGGNDSAISQQEESEDASDAVGSDASISGVILEMDEATGVVSVYSAKTKDTQVFNLMKAELLTDAHGNSISYEALRVGDLVDVTYRTGTENKVRRLRLSSSETAFKDVSGATVDRSAGLIRINNKNYTYDSNLICQYQGEDLNPASITERYVFNGAALDGHIYRITVTHAEGTVEVKGIEDAGDTTEETKIVFTPTVGKKVEAVITKNMTPIALTEGFNHYVVERAGETLVSGSVFVNSGERTVLTLNSIGKQTGELELQIRPEDADVTITLDGKKQSKKLIQDVEYGDHEIVIQAEGYEEYKQSISLKQPYLPVTINLKQTDVTVSVSASLKDTVVYCDGRYIGLYDGTPVQFRLDPGSYELTLAHSGYEILSYKLQIESGSPAVDLYFSRFVPQVQYGQISLSILPADLPVRILMDNVQQSSTTISNVEYGEHEIRVSSDGYNEFETTVKVDKENVTVSVMMERSTGNITVVTDPAGAEVTLDGTVFGNGKFSDVPYGDHVLVITADGYERETVMVTVDRAEVSVNVTLTKIPEESSKEESSKEESSAEESSETSQEESSEAESSEDIPEESSADEASADESQSEGSSEGSTSESSGE